MKNPFSLFFAQLLEILVANREAVEGMPAIVRTHFLVDLFLDQVAEV
jgi:hypothetical protein